MMSLQLSTLEPSTVVLTAIAVALSVYLMSLKVRRKRKPGNTPPYPSPPSFFFGHLGQMAGNTRLKMREWRCAAGDLYSLDFAGQQYIIVNGYKAYKDVLVSHAGDVQQVPESFMSTILNEHNKGIAESNGPNWEEQRKASLSILRALGLGKNILAERIQEEVSVYLVKLAGHKGESMDVKMLTTVSVSNIICSIAIGRRFDHDDPFFNNLVENMGKATKYFAYLPLVTLFPWLYHLPGDLFHAKKLVAIFKDINANFSLAHIRQIEADISRGDFDKPDNFIAYYLSKINKRNREGKATNMDEANLVAVLRNLFIAGTDTASGNILWFFLYMMHYPSIQEKIFQEIAHNVGVHRQVSLEDKPKLPYLVAAIMETQRHASVTPFASPRVVASEFQVDGYVFPVGCHILPNIDSVLHDQKIWGNPEDFCPERFLDQSGHLVEPDEFIPFSIGRRNCLGESMAKMELFLFLSGVIQRFELKPEESSQTPPLEDVFGAICSPRPYKIRFIERKY